MSVSTFKDPKPDEEIKQWLQGSKKYGGQGDHFYSSTKPWFSLSRKIWNPPTDIYETQDTLLIKMEVAGVQEEHLDISVDDNLLVIRGVRMEENLADKASIHLLEVHYGKFERSFKLPENLQVNDIDANYRNGFLRVAINKSDVHPKPISIDIKLKG